MEKLLAAAADFIPDDPLLPTTKLGPVVTIAQRDKIINYYHDAITAGAEPLLPSPVAKGCYLSPMILDKIHPNMAIAQEEVFGPLLAVIGFSNEEQAIASANNSCYGLAAALWSRDINRVLRVADKLQAGLVSVNCFDGGDITTPFGGMRQSGFGRDKGRHALDKYTASKTIWIERA